MLLFYILHKSHPINNYSSIQYLQSHIIWRPWIERRSHCSRFTICATGYGKFGSPVLESSKCHNVQSTFFSESACISTFSMVIIINQPYCPFSNRTLPKDGAL